MSGFIDVNFSDARMESIEVIDLRNGLGID